MTTAAAFNPMAVSLAFVTAETAFAAYQLALTTGEASAFESAAHALAGALKAERARRMAPRPGMGARPRLVVDNDPQPQSAHGQANPPMQSASAAPKPQRQSARAAGILDFDAALPPVRRTWPAGSFLVEWADGSVTRVQGVAWATAKPQTRWVRAYQAANRVRRLRHGRVLEADLGGRSAIPGRFTYLSGGVQTDSPAWRDLLKTTPLPAFASVTDETTGETFSAPEGSAFGAGDPETARRIEADLCTPRLPWLAADAARSCELMGQDHRFGVAYLIRSGDTVHTGVASPWPDAYRRARLAEAVAAFTPEAVPVTEPAAVPAEAVSATTAEEIEGWSVTTTEAAVNRAHEIALDACAAYEASRASRDAVTIAQARRAADETAARVTVLRSVIGLVWTARRAPGGVVKLERPGRGVILSRAALDFLHRAA